MTKQLYIAVPAEAIWKLIAAAMEHSKDKLFNGLEHVTNRDEELVIRATAVGAFIGYENLMTNLHEQLLDKIPKPIPADLLDDFNSLDSLGRDIIDELNNLIEKECWS